MVDVLTKKQRSYCMSQIRKKDTRPELLLRDALSGAGIRGYRLHCNLAGKPDIVFSTKRIVIFIDGCFWHKCPRCFKSLSTRKKYWVRKISSNVKRDRAISKQLRNEGWKIVRFWEHAIKKDLKRCVVTVNRLIQSGKDF